MKFEQLYEFRKQADECLGNAAWATFERAALPKGRLATSDVYQMRLTSPLFRRQWSSIVAKRYKTFDLRLEQLMQLYIHQMSQVERPVLAIAIAFLVVKTPCTYPQRTYTTSPKSCNSS
jgi:hypothetical protein